VVHFRTGPDDLAPIVSGSHDDNDLNLSGENTDPRAYRGARAGGLLFPGSHDDNDWNLSEETTDPRAFRGATAGGLLSDVKDTEEDYYTS